jgi:hypothetical protein
VVGWSQLGKECRVREELSILNDRLSLRTDATQAILEPNALEALAGRALALARVATALHLAGQSLPAGTAHHRAEAQP